MNEDSPLTCVEDCLAMNNAEEKHLSENIQKEILSGPEKLNNDLIDYTGEPNLVWSAH